jgi:hypothetical protein
MRKQIEMDFDLDNLLIESIKKIENVKSSVFNPKTGWVSVGFFQKISGFSWVLGFSKILTNLQKFYEKF